MWSELKGFIPTPLICPNSATADWGRGFRPPPLPNHSAIEAAESGRPTDDEHGDEGEFNGTRGVGLTLDYKCEVIYQLLSLNSIFLFFIFIVYYLAPDISL